MKTTVSSNGQVTLPTDLLQRDGIKFGQLFEIKRLRSGEYLLKKVREPQVGLMTWLLSCPEEEWFQPLPSESTDAIGEF